MILPTLNEAENIVPLIERLRAAVPELHEIVVVDDASTDGTAELAEGIGDPRIRVERRRTDPGLTKSIAHGASVATGDVLVWMDCDLSMPPEDVPRLLAEVARGTDIAVGSRFVEGGRGKGDTGGTPDPQVTVLLSAGLNVALRLLLDRRFRDWTSGFIAIRREVLRTLGLRGDHGEYFIDLMYRALRRRYRVVEIPYVIVPRQRGTSKTASSLRGYVRRGLQYVGIALSLRWDAARGRI